MTTRKGMNNISGNYVVHHQFSAFFIHVLCIMKNGRSDRIVFHIVFKTPQPSDTMF